MAGNNRRSQMTKLLFRTSLMELMSEKTINKITIKDICEGADLNRSTFYLHYTDQYNLLKDIENEVIGKTLDYVKEIATDADELSYVQALLDYLRDNKRITKTLFNNAETREFQTAFVNSIILHIQQIEKGTLEPKKEKYIYAYIVQGCFNLIREWINSDFDLPSNEIAELILHLSTISLTVKNDEAHFAI